MIQKSFESFEDSGKVKNSQVKFHRFAIFGENETPLPNMDSIKPLRTFGDASRLGTTCGHFQTSCTGLQKNKNAGPSPLAVYCTLVGRPQVPMSRLHEHNKSHRFSFVLSFDISCPPRVFCSWPRPLHLTTPIASGQPTLSIQSSLQSGHISGWNSAFAKTESLVSIQPSPCCSDQNIAVLSGGVGWGGARKGREGVEPAARKTWPACSHKDSCLSFFAAVAATNPLQMDDVWAHSAIRRIIMTGLFAEERGSEREREGRTAAVGT